MVLKPVLCPSCLGIEVVKHGKSSENKQRYFWQSQFCSCQTFILDYSYKGRLAETKQQIIELALNGSGSRDTSRVLGINTATVINQLKKRNTQKIEREKAHFKDSNLKVCP